MNDFLVVNSFGADTSFWSQKPTEWIEKWEIPFGVKNLLCGADKIRKIQV